MAVRKSLRKRPPVKTSVRRSQLITTYGIGSLLPVESESFMVAGLEHWQPRPELEIQEPRLSSLLGVSKLYCPPGGDVGGMLPMVRFPEWVSCPKCNRLDRFWKIAEKIADKYENRCRHCVGVRLIPSRFVACCPGGHIQDFPYEYWVHQGQQGEEGQEHSLRVTTNPSDGSLGGIWVSCKCGASRSLQGALGSGSLNVRCSGRSPWLDNEWESCDQTVVGLQRGASNVWFGDVRSALTVDRELSPVERVLEFILPELDGVHEEDIPAFVSILARKHGVQADSLLDAFRKRSDDPQDSSERYRQLRASEYEALGRLHPEVEGTETFVCYPESNSVGDTASPLIDLVSRVSRLREVRALTGFSRVTGIPEDGGLSLGRLSRTRVGWLPAMEVLGEGVFVRLDEELLNAWDLSAFARARARLVTEGMQEAAAEREGNISPVSTRFLLLHSLSHALIHELSLSAGYPASSIRERIYFDPGQSGILLYTATADAAGSLGGLCSHGSLKNVSRILESAMENVQWCSADPVCLESVATGAGASNLAACHSCLLVPEVSCEHQNRILDRGCLVGAEEDSAGGFLTDFV